MKNSESRGEGEIIARLKLRNVSSENVDFGGILVAFIWDCIDFRRGFYEMSLNLSGIQQISWDFMRFHYIFKDFRRLLQISWNSSLISEDFIEISSALYTGFHEWLPPRESQCRLHKPIESPPA